MLTSFTSFIKYKKVYTDIFAIDKITKKNIEEKLILLFNNISEYSDFLKTNLFILWKFTKYNENARKIIIDNIMNILHTDTITNFIVMFKEARKVINTDIVNCYECDSYYSKLSYGEISFCDTHTESIEELKYSINFIDVLISHNIETIDINFINRFAELFKLIPEKMLENYYINFSEKNIVSDYAIEIIFGNYNIWDSNQWLINLESIIINYIHLLDKYKYLQSIKNSIKNFINGFKITEIKNPTVCIKTLVLLYKCDFMSKENFFTLIHNYHIFFEENKINLKIYMDENDYYDYCTTYDITVVDPRLINKILENQMLINKKMDLIMEKLDIK